MKLKIWPWDFGEKPYWVNPENKLEWYVDKSTTDWCTRDTLNDMPKLEAICFIVVERDGDKFEPISRVLIDKKTNEVLADETALDVMATKIDMLRTVLNFKDEKVLDVMDTKIDMLRTILNFNDEKDI